MNPNKKNIEIIKQFNLSPHPEGGWFREIVRSENSLIREDGQSRNFITGIYYLLERDAKSAWHRVKNADEIWIYLRGDPLNLWCLDNDNKLIRNLILDSNNPVEMIPSGYWQAAKSTGEFTLVSCCVGPVYSQLELSSNSRELNCKELSRSWTPPELNGTQLYETVSELNSARVERM